MLFSGCFRKFSGWIAGCVAATMVIVALPIIVTSWLSGWSAVRLVEGITLLVGYSSFVFTMTCLITPIPAIFVVLLSGVLQKRSITFFAGAGMTIGALVIALFARSFVVWTFSIGALFAAAGLAAGGTYWSISGRHEICPARPQS